MTVVGNLLVRVGSELGREGRGGDGGRVGGRLRLKIGGVSACSRNPLLQSGHTMEFGEEEIVTNLLHL